MRIFSWMLLYLAQCIFVLLRRRSCVPATLADRPLMARLNVNSAGARHVRCPDSYDHSV